MTQKLTQTFIDGTYNYDPDIAILAFMDCPEITDTPTVEGVVDNKGGIEIEENPIQRRCQTNGLHPTDNKRRRHRPKGDC